MADVSQIKLPNGSVYDLIDEKSGYITAEYIENKTDYEIPVSRVGEIVVGETAIGTDSTNFPTSKAVVDYVDERVVQEMDAIDVGVTGIKADGTSLSVVDGVVNIPAIGPNQSVGLMTQNVMNMIGEELNNVSNLIPTSISQLNNDSGFITASDIPAETDPTVPAWAKASTKPTYTASEVGALPDSTVIPEDKIFIATYGTTTLAEVSTAYNAGKIIFAKMSNKAFAMLVSYSSNSCRFGAGRDSSLTILDWTLSSNGWQDNSYVYNSITEINTIEAGDYIPFVNANSLNRLSRSNSLVFGTSTSQYLANNGTWQSIPTVPTNISSFTNDSGYLTASDIASVMTYKGTKANYAALPSTGNTTGDVWHLTDTGAEWAWDGSGWQELGTAIDLSGYATKATTLAGYGITDAKIQNGTITLGSNTITPLTSFTETDPTVPSWAKQSSKPTYTASEVGAMSTSHAANGITTAKINAWDAKSDFSGSYNDLTDKPTIPTVPTNISAFTNDSGYLTSYTETDPTVPSWAKASSKPSYGLTEISGTDDLRAIEALTGTSGLLKKTAANTWTLDTNTYLTSYTETDPTVPSWAKQSSKPTYTAAEVGALPDSTAIPSKTSDLTNDSGFITSDSDEKLAITRLKNNLDNGAYYPIIAKDSPDASTRQYDKIGLIYEATHGSGSSSNPGQAKLILGNNWSSTTGGNKQGILNLYGSTSYKHIIQGAPTADRTITLPDKDGTLALTSDIPTVPTKVSDLTNDSGFISSYTETDPVFSASAAAGITSTDISNWNAKVSDDHKWAAVTLGDGRKDDTSDLWIPAKTDNHNTSGTAYWIKTTQELPTSAAVEYVQVPRYKKINGSWYLQSTTPSANDNSTKVATTAYVDAAIPKVYSSTNTGGYLTMATLPIYDGTVE